MININYRVDWHSSYFGGFFANIMHLRSRVSKQTDDIIELHKITHLENEAHAILWVFRFVLFCFLFSLICMEFSGKFQPDLT